MRKLCKALLPAAGNKRSTAKPEIKIKNRALEEIKQFRERSLYLYS